MGTRYNRLSEAVLRSTHNLYYFRPVLTEKLLNGTLSLNTNKQIMYILDQTEENMYTQGCIPPGSVYIKCGCKGFTLHGNVCVMLIQKSDAIF